MLVIEQAEAARKQLELKIFATDTQDDNLNKARDGVYQGFLHLRPHSLLANGFEFCADCVIPATAPSNCFAA
jgi:two-component system, chemotaxis family, CheB/CheR fusion protein